jgi:hypothetical protein
VRRVSDPPRRLSEAPHGDSRSAATPGGLARKGLEKSSVDPAQLPDDRVQYRDNLNGVKNDKET